MCLSKSANKHNRLYSTAEPLADELTEKIEKGDIGPNEDPKERSRKLVQDYNWEKNESYKIWAFGPETTGPNLLVDATKGVQYMAEIRDSCESAFQWVTREGVVCEEAMRGIKFNMHDVELHADAIHRGGG